MNKLLKYGVAVLWVVILATPAAIFISSRDAAAYTEASSIFPLFGLIAFTLIWSQIMLGAFMRPLEKIYPKIFPLHIFFGIATLIFAVLHPFLFTLNFIPDRLSDYLSYSYTTPALKTYVQLGQIGFLLLVAGVLAGLLRNWPPIKRYWHWFHLVNYAVFFLTFFHSWNLGTDVQGSEILRSLWIFFGVTVIIGFIYRRIYVVSKEGLAKSTS